MMDDGRSQRPDELRSDEDAECVLRDPCYVLRVKCCVLCAAWCENENQVYRYTTEKDALRT